MYRKKYRRKVFEILGGEICTCNEIGCWHSGICGITDYRILHLDHINGGGRKDRKKNSRNILNYYRRYINDVDLAKKTLQVRCANCNWLKMQKGEANYSVDCG